MNNQVNAQGKQQKNKNKTKQNKTKQNYAKVVELHSMFNHHHITSMASSYEVLPHDNKMALSQETVILFSGLDLSNCQYQEWSGPARKCINL